MLDMGFEEPIREIAGRTHRDRQSLLFSATFPDSIRAMARDLLREAVEVTVEGADQAPPSAICSARLSRRTARRRWPACC